MISLLIETFVKAFVLLILVYVVARGEADYDFRKVAMVTAGIVLGCVVIEGLLFSRIGLFVLLPMAAFIVFMVMKFCWVRFWKSLLIIRSGRMAGGPKQAPHQGHLGGKRWRTRRHSQ